ncbi:MAG: hypothetical protein WKF61_03745 [Luteimonas sp.]
MATDSLLLKFKDSDTYNTVTRKTLREMARLLGYSETQVLQTALSRLRAEVLPGYLPDDGPVPTAMIRHIRKTVDQDDYKPTRTLLPGL